MTFTLARSRYEDDGIFGELSKDDVHFCFTLEHSYNDKPKIPAGTYTCVRGQHQLHSGPIETFEVKNVPGCTGILLHYGNTDKDSEGCILLGTTQTTDAIGNSRAAFSLFMSVLAGKDSFTLIVE